MKKIKTFDCVEMKRSAQEKIYNEIKNMSLEDELKYWQNIHKAHESEYKKSRNVKSRC